MNPVTKRSTFWGIGAAALLFLFYLIVLTLANSFEHAIDQFVLLWYWIVPLIVGFGIQAGLFAYSKKQIAIRKEKASKKEMVASAGLSTGSMVACCAHHLVDVLPILGFSAAFLFLAKYQVFFLVVGIVSNIIGIIFLLEIIKKHSLYEEESIFARLASIDMTKVKRLAVIAGIIVLPVSFLWIRGTAASDYSSASASSVAMDITNEEVLPGVSQAPVSPVNQVSNAEQVLTRSEESNGLTIEATPAALLRDAPLQFEISFNTHQGDLDFNLLEQAQLIVDQDKVFKPTEWDGGAGGHHLVGNLFFPGISDDASEMKLVINDVYDSAERVFNWAL